ncbi:MAG: hypothetical protein Q3988_00430 [Gemella sp.]|nr:hypothetical protein [Gemella sp.]
MINLLRAYSFLYAALNDKKYWERNDVIEITNLKPAGYSKLIKIMKELTIIIPVRGQGKGKYKFSF